MKQSDSVDDEPILVLRNAIIEQAARDYITRGESQMRELRRFFGGKWCKALLDMDRFGDNVAVDAIIELLEERRKKRRGGNAGE